MDLTGTAALITGASRGLGKAVLLEFANRGAFTIGAATERSREILREQAKKVKGGYAVFDGTNEDSVRELIKRVREMIETRNINHLYIFSGAAKHEHPIVEEKGTIRYSTEEDVSVRDLELMKNLNIKSHELLYQAVRELGIPSTFGNVSSQAADSKWWKLGNSIYGPQKKQSEEMFLGLAETYDNPRVVAFRYPFIDTDMAKHLYTELIKIDAGLHVGGKLENPPLAWEDISLPPEVVAYDTVDLMVDSSPSFRRLDQIVYNYEKTVEEARRAA